MRVRLAGEGAGGRVARLEGLCGSTRVGEVVRLAGEALGVATSGATGVRLRLRVDTRELREEETLAEAGVGAGGAEEVWVVVGVPGGMRPGVDGALDALQAQVSGFVSVVQLTDLGEQQEDRSEQERARPVLAEQQERAGEQEKRSQLEERSELERLSSEVERLNLLSRLDMLRVQVAEGGAGASSDGSASKLVQELRAWGDAVVQLE